MSEDARYPVLVAAPGMRLEDCAARSTAVFRVPPENARPCLGQPHGPHALHLLDDAHGFELPAGLFSLLEAEGGVVFRIRASPHVGYVDQEGAFALGAEIARLLTAKGWTIHEERAAGALRTQLAKVPEAIACTFGARNWRAEIRLRRAVAAQSAEGRLLQLARDGYLVTLLVEEERPRS